MAVIRGTRHIDLSFLKNLIETWWELHLNWNMMGNTSKLKHDGEIHLNWNMMGNTSKLKHDGKYI